MTFIPILIGGADGITTMIMLQKGFPVFSEDKHASAQRAIRAETSVTGLLGFRVVRRAFEGMKRGYFVYPTRAWLIEATAYYAQTASEEGTASSSTFPGAPRARMPSNTALARCAAERLFDRSGVPASHLRPKTLNECLLYMRRGQQPTLRHAFRFRRQVRRPVMARNSGV